MTRMEVALQLRKGAFNLDVSFHTPGRGVVALFGHSGSGKSTILRCLAGLERGSGRIAINGEVWQDSATGDFVPPHRRGVGYVFQEPSLFPHFSVRENLAYGFKRVPERERRVRFDDAVALLGIERLLERSPARLSGGERQRVAIARALLASPKLLLMDEPLSALDEKSKREIIPYLERLHAELAIPAVLVSHSLREVERLADHIVWLENGCVRDAGAITQLLGSVAMAQAEEDAGTVVEAVVALHDEQFQLTALDSSCGRLWVHRMYAPPRQKVRVRLPARDVSIALEAESGTSILNQWRARIEEVVPTTPGQVLVRMGAGERYNVPLLACITAKSASHLQLGPGAEVYARIKSVGLLE